MSDPTSKTTKIEPDDLRNWADEYDNFDRRAGTLQATHVGGGAVMLREAADEIERLRSLDPCLSKREPEEPMFVLLGRDSAAPYAIVQWCLTRANEIRSGRRPDTTEEWSHIKDVRAKTAAFADWRSKNRPSV